jgi:metal-sulfur cluster biosynthetic enzyme
LRACYDSSHPYKRPVNIVDLGLVESLHLSVDPEAPGTGIAGVPQRQVVKVTLLAPSEDEGARAQLAAVVSNRLAGLPQVWRSEIVFDAAGMWTPDRVRPAGRQILGLDFPILNNKV